VDCPRSIAVPSCPRGRASLATNDRRGGQVIEHHSCCGLERRHQSVVTEIRRLGKQLVPDASRPPSDFDIGASPDRKVRGRLLIGGNPNCYFDRADYRRKRGDVLALLETTTGTSNVEMIRFDPWLCDAEKCETRRVDALLYRDGGHLSHDGSRLLAQTMRLGALVLQQAH